MAGDLAGPQLEADLGAHCVEEGVVGHADDGLSVLPPHVDHEELVIHLAERYLRQPTRPLDSVLTALQLQLQALEFRARGD